VFRLDNINNSNNFRFNFSNYFAIIIYTMASLQSSGQSSGQSASDILTTVVEVYCTDQLLQLLGWTRDRLNSIEDNTPADWDSSRAGDRRQICRYSGSLMDGRNVLRGVAQGSLTAMCKFGLPDSYVRSQLQGSVYADAVDETSMPTNVILIQRDINVSTGQRGPIRGLSLIQVTIRPDPTLGHYGSGKKITSAMLEGKTVQDLQAMIQMTELEVLVLGNAAVTQVKTRLQKADVMFASGGLTIRAIQTIGALLPRGIGLHGLDTVISLYYKFGWRFVNGCGAEYTESAMIPPAVRNLMQFHREVGGADLTDVGEAHLQTLLKPFNSFSHHFYSALHKGAEGDDDEEMYGQKEAAKEVLEDAQNNGFRMLLCQQFNIMFYIVTNRQWPLNANGKPQMPNINREKRGGKRRRRKRTKKRALKKRHRRTRRRRKRKTRRKKRRGGKKRLSRKQCHSLKQKHTKMTHQIKSFRLLNIKLKTYYLIYV
jgi:hypothetical protein